MTAIKRRAQIQWLTKEAGGRDSIPTGGTYSTVACFETSRKWMEEEWSVVLEKMEPPNKAGTAIADIRMLMGDEAPPNLLESGSKFELYEGRQCVARGVVL